jgi:hypothetical protein
VNNNILKLLKQNLAENLRKRFIKLLSDEENFDLQQFFPKQPLSKTNKIFIDAIYGRTKSCIAQVSPILDTVTDSLLTKFQLTKSLNPFKISLGINNGHNDSLLAKIQSFFPRWFSVIWIELSGLV